MTVKEYLQNKTLTSLQIANEVLLSIVTTEDNVQVNSDTSNLVMGTPVVEVTDYVMDGDIIRVGTVEYDTTVLTVNVPENE